MNTYYYIYEITNLINGKRYRGQHKTTNLNDNYMGSGVAINAAYEKYGINNFHKNVQKNMLKGEFNYGN